MKNQHSILVFILLASFLMNNLNAQINMSINTDVAKRKPISPYIYGLNAYVFDNTWGGGAWKTGLNNHGSQANLEKMNVTSFRLGGNAASSLNWEQGANNAGQDDAHKNSTYQTYISTGTNASPQPAFYTPNAAYIKTQNDALFLGARALIQLPSAGYVAADITSSTCGTPIADPTRWKQVINNKPTALTLTPDLSDNKVYIDECINHLINQFGNSTATNGIKFYQTDNEVGLWCLRGNAGAATGTHSVMLNNTFTTCVDIINKTKDLAKTIKRMDPGALVFSSGIWNYIEAFSLWSKYDGASYQPNDWGLYNNEPYKTNNTGQQFRYNQMTWQNVLLANMKDWEVTEGKRLIDVLSIHYYPQENLTNTNRFHNTRSLWDSTYVETSWLTQVGNGLTEGRGLRMIPLVQRAINDFYPGTKIAITEYDFYGRDHISGTLAQADALGIFGRHGVFLATYFGTADQYISPAFQLYRNYDGNKSTFGDTDIESTTADVVNSSIYSSVQSGNDSILHIILINKSNAAQTAQIQINSGIAYNKLIGAYGIAESDGSPNLSSKPKINVYTGTDLVAENKLQFSMQASSSYHLVLRSIPAVKSSEKDILTFKLSNSILTTANIQGTNIYDTVSSTADIANATPAFTISTLATANPATGVARDFSSPATYTITAEDGSTKIYTVYVAKNGGNTGAISNPINKIQIYPNPIQDVLTIESDAIQSVEIRDVLGQIVLQHKQMPNPHNCQINVSELTSGIYFLKIISKNQETATYKISKN